MNDYQTISSSPPKHTGMNFELLRKEGVEIIQHLAGSNWTDYNAHDPGLTILEHLCYAITDLCYRLDFEMEDLLAYPGTSHESPVRQFFTAREILTVSPVTINDYRKLLINIDGVKNAWLETHCDDQPRIYYKILSESEDITEISFKPLSSCQKTDLRGFYKVLLEKADETVDDSQLLQEVKETLRGNRNLCEDFAEITILGAETIKPDIELEIQESADPNQVAADVYLELSQCVSPEIKFYSPYELLKKNKSAGEIFNGPRFDRDFIDDDELKEYDRRKEIHVSDLINVILDQSGVKTVRKISISGDIAAGQSWVLKLNASCAPRMRGLKEIMENGEVRLFKGDIPCVLNQAEIEKRIEASENRMPELPQDDKVFKLPNADYRNLYDYLPLRHDFPSNYGIADGGLPDSAPDLRKAQANQLKAYLMFFDQILSNYFVQLDQSKNLLSSLTEKNATYFSQSPEDSQDILDPGAPDPNEALGDGEDNEERKHRLLNHLLARFGEEIIDYSRKTSGELGDDKNYLLQNYPNISYNRARAKNFHKETDVYKLKKIVFKKMGLSAVEDDFYLLEHILLYPRKLPDDAGVDWTQRTVSLKGCAPDPYSFWITVVYPKSKPEYGDLVFESRFLKILDSEVPAHINIRVSALDDADMTSFQTSYQELLNAQASDDPVRIETAAAELMLMLGIRAG